MKLPEGIPLRREPDALADQGVDGSGMILSGALILIAALLWIWWLKRKSDGNPSVGNSGRWPRWLVNSNSGVTVLSATRLTAKHSLHEVEWQGKRLLLGCTSQSVQVLAQSDAESMTAPVTRHRPETSVEQNP